MIDVNKVIAYESGEMDEEEFLEFFQGLVNSGMAWQLQGHYGRTAAALLDQGRIVPPDEFSRRIIINRAAQDLADEGSALIDAHQAMILKNRLLHKHSLDIPYEVAFTAWVDRLPNQ